MVGFGPRRAVLAAALACSSMLFASQASADTGTRVAPAQAAGSTRLITPRGIGRVRIGMTLSQARRASHRRITGGTRDINPGCSYARVPSMKLSLMMINHRISRIETRSSGLHTIGGISVGDDDSSVFDFFGGDRVKKYPHVYVPGGRYLRLDWGRGRYAKKGLLYVTDADGTITEIYSGRRATLGYVEGCV